MAQLHPVLLCVGSGTRLWPLPRKSYPKQLSKLIGAKSLIRSSAQRPSGELVAPSEDAIPDTEAFKAAIPRAEAGAFFTFGIAPDRAETGYGHFELALDAQDSADAPQDLVQFVEKPEDTRAEEMLKAGNFCGMLAFSLLGRGDNPSRCRPCAQNIKNVQSAVDRDASGMGELEHRRRYQCLSVFI